MQRHEYEKYEAVIMASVVLHYPELAQGYHIADVTPAMHDEDTTYHAPDFHLLVELRAEGDRVRLVVVPNPVHKPPVRHGGLPEFEVLVKWSVVAESEDQARERLQPYLDSLKVTGVSIHSMKQVAS